MGPYTRLRLTMTAAVAPLTAAVLALALLAGVVLYLGAKPNRRLPPGPKGVPLLGNIFDIPKKREWLAYQRWSREFSAHFAIYYPLSTIHYISSIIHYILRCVWVLKTD